MHSVISCNLTIHDIRIKTMCTRDKPAACVEVLETPTKLEKDKKEYRAIKLGNGMKVLLISQKALYGTNENETDRKSRKISTELLAGVALGTYFFFCYF